MLCSAWASPTPSKRGISRAGSAFGSMYLAFRLSWCIAVTAPLLLAAGCAAPRPNFLEVIQRNCEQGDAEACDLLASIGPATGDDAEIAPPVHARDIVEAILAGMRQARQNYARHYEPAPVPLEDPDQN